MNDTQRTIAEYVMQHPGSTSADVARDLFLVRGTTRLNLMALTEMEQIRRWRDGRDYRYAAVGIVFCQHCGHVVNGASKDLAEYARTLEKEVARLRQLESAALIAVSALEMAVR
jgi:hypothetical protein